MARARVMRKAKSTVVAAMELKLGLLHNPNDADTPF